MSGYTSMKNTPATSVEHRGHWITTNMEGWGFNWYVTLNGVLMASGFTRSLDGPRDRLAVLAATAVIDALFDEWELQRQRKLPHP